MEVAQLLKNGGKLDLIYFNLLFYCITSPPIQKGGGAFSTLISCFTAIQTHLSEKWREVLQNNRGAAVSNQLLRSPKYHA
jgi:hypothetical protein